MMIQCLLSLTVSKEQENNMNFGGFKQNSFKMFYYVKNGTCRNEVSRYQCCNAVLPLMQLLLLNVYQ